jgi:hypothetical protein
MDALLQSLQGGDRRSIGAVPLVVRQVLAQPRLFAVVFDGMSEPDPLVAMRARGRMLLARLGPRQDAALAGRDPARASA